MSQYMPPPSRGHGNQKSHTLRTVLIVLACVLFVPVACTAAVVSISNDDGEPRDSVTADAIIPPVAGDEPKGLPAPKGVKVSGEYATSLQVKSFKIGQTGPILRIVNQDGDARKYIGVKVVAVRGDDVLATADGVIESIESGQTITTQPWTSDTFPRAGTKGVTYEVELD